MKINGMVLVSAILLAVLGCETQATFDGAPEWAITLDGQRTVSVALPDTSATAAVICMDANENGLADIYRNEVEYANRMMSGGYYALVSGSPQDGAISVQIVAPNQVYRRDANGEPQLVWTSRTFVHYYKVSKYRRDRIVYVTAQWNSGDEDMIYRDVNRLIAAAECR